VYGASDEQKVTKTQSGSYEEIYVTAIKQVRITIEVKKSAQGCQAVAYTTILSQRARLSHAFLQLGAFGVLEHSRAVTLHQNAARRLLACDEHSSNTSGFIRDGTVAVRPPHIFQSSIPLDRQILILMPRRFTAAHYLFDLRSDSGPDLEPEVRCAGAERPGVSPAAAEAGAVCVVVELNAVGSPEKEHRVAVLKHDSDGGAGTLWPRLDRAERGSCPVILPAQLAHFAGSGEYGFNGRR
jgi:hypothetical protein